LTKHSSASAGRPASRKTLPKLNHTKTSRGNRLASRCKQRFRFAEPAFHGERVRDTELELRCARIEAARLAKCFPGIRVAGKSEVRLRQVAEDAGLIAARARCALEVVDRCFGLPELQQRRPEQVERVRMVGRYRERLPVRVFRGIEIAPCMLAQAGLDLGLQKALVRLHRSIMTGRLPLPRRRQGNRE
jgi:hypothetical protein